MMNFRSLNAPYLEQCLDFLIEMKNDNMVSGDTHCMEKFKDNVVKLLEVWISIEQLIY